MSKNNHAQAHVFSRILLTKVFLQTGAIGFLPCTVKELQIQILRLNSAHKSFIIEYYVVLANAKMSASDKRLISENTKELHKNYLRLFSYEETSLKRIVSLCS